MMYRTSALALLALAACNDAPTLTSVAVGPDTPSTLDDLTLQIGEVRDTQRSNDLGVLISWTVNGAPVATLDGKFTVPSTLTAAGDVWSAKVVATDGQLESLPWTASIQIANTAPTAAVVITPGNPQPGEAIQAVAQTGDVDDTPVSVTWHWQRNGQPTEYNGDTLPQGITNRGEEWTVAAIPNDGVESGEPAILDIVIGNSAPQLHRVAVGSESNRATHDLQVTVSATDADDDDLAFRYTWLIDGTPITHSTPVLPAAFFRRDQQVDVWVVASDDRSQSEPMRGSVVVQNTPPVLQSASLNTDRAGVEDTLTCTPGTGQDADGDAIEYLYYWRVNEALRSRDPIFSGFERGDEVTCIVVPTDGTDAGEPATSPTLRIDNTAPQLDGVVLDTPELKTAIDGSVSVLGAVDPDGDSIQARYLWSVNGVVVSNESKIGSAWYSKGARVEVQVTPTDGLDDGVPVYGDWVVQNSAPVIETARLSGDNREGGSLVVINSASDDDGDALQTRVDWYVTGNLVGETSDTLDSSWFERGDQVMAVVHVSDGDGGSASATAGPFIIANSAPTLGDVSISNPSPAVGETVQAIHEPASDPDSDPVSIEYVWTVDGQTIASGAQLEIPAIPAGSVLQVSAQPSDGSLFGTAQTSAPVTVSNAIPSVTSVSVLPASDITVNTVLVAEWDATDPEGEPLDAQYAWQVNGTTIQADTASIPVWLVAERGDEIRVSVSVTDGGSLSEPVTSAPVTVGNAEPARPSLALIPSTPQPSTPLQCVIETEFADPDNDALEYTFTWLRDGDDYTGTLQTTAHPGDTIPGDRVGQGETWECQVVANDGTADSPVGATDADVAHDDDSITGQFTAHGYQLYRVGPYPSDNSDIDAYAQACADIGLAPVSCDPATEGASYDASAWSALPLPAADFGCQVGATIATATGWQDIATIALVDDGIALERDQPVPSDTFAVCGAIATAE